MASTATFNFHSTGVEVANAYKDRIPGKTILITGASDKGIGAATAIALAAGKPAHLLLTARTTSEAKVAPVIAQIKTISPETKTTFIGIDLHDLDSVRAGADKINSLITRLDILIQNAGVIAIPYATNADGVEMTLAQNYLGHFLLQTLLMDKLLAAAPGARILNSASSAHRISYFDFDDWGFSGGATYDRWAAYGQSKTALVLNAAEVKARYGARGILAYSVHPGTILSTPLIHHLTMEDFAGVHTAAARITGEKFNVEEFKSAEQGAASLVYASLSPDIEKESGAFLMDCKIVPQMEYAKDKENSRKLWELALGLVQTRLPGKE